MSSKSKWFALCTFIVLCVVMVLYYFTRNTADTVNQQTPSAAESHNNIERYTEPDSMSSAEVAPNSSEMEAYVDRMVNEVADRFTGKADDPSAWIMLFDFYRYLLRSFPEEGSDLFELILRTAFLDQAEKIIDTINAMDSYHSWYAENQLMLAKQPSVVREQLLWQKREELLGDQAGELWSPHRLSDSRRQFDDRLAALRYSENTSLDDKVFIMQTAISDMESSNNTMDARRVALPETQSSLFLNMPSVQEDLQALNNEERVEALSALRKSFGYTEEQIESLVLQDEERDARWDRGLAYMNDRAALSNTLKGDELDEAMSELRQSYFGEEAEMIRREEAINFYRYKRQRIYGVN